MESSRYVSRAVERYAFDASLTGRHMVFLAGPRQAGKTLLARRWLEKKRCPDLYFNWDDPRTRRVRAAGSRDAFEALWRFGPFPEPFLRQGERFSRKWHLDYVGLIVRQEMKDLTRIAELDRIEQMLFLLPSRLMSPLSMPGLARDLEVAHTTVKAWLEALRGLYMIFPVVPWSRKVARGLRKEKKWYFLDWVYAPEGPARLENMAASCLERACSALTDMGHGTFALHYARTLDKREIDFVVSRDGKPVAAVEVKSGETSLSRTLRERHGWLGDGTLGVQVVDRKDVLEKHPGGTWVVSVDRFLSTLV